MTDKRRNLRNRPIIFGIMLLALMLVSSAALAGGTALDGPNPAIWLSDPEGDDGDNGIEQGDHVEGSSGMASVTEDGARVRVNATGLEPGHVYAMWVVYFNDSTLCVDGCNGPDFATAGGGVIWGDGQIANEGGLATFQAELETGDGADYIGPPPPPYAVATYEAGPNNEFHVVVRSHGPQIDGLVRLQLSTFGGGCDVSVGPAPEEIGDFPVPSAPGECGNVQLYVFK